MTSLASLLPNDQTLRAADEATTFTLIGADGEERTSSIADLRVGFSHGFVFELLDTSRADAQALAVHVLVLNPRSYTLSEPFQLTLTPAEDDSVVSEQVGIVVREITLEGTFGLSEKTPQGFGGAQGRHSGTKHFQLLRNLFRQYSALKKDPARSPFIQLVFHALRDDDHFVVEPRSFDTPRDARSTRAHYDYRISMAAIGPATQSTLEGSRTFADERVRFLDPSRDIFQSFNDARAAYAEIVRDLDNIKAEFESVEAILGNAAQFLNLTGQFLSNTASLINFPLDLALRIAGQFEYGADRLVAGFNDLTIRTRQENARKMRRLAAAIDSITMYPDKFSAGARALSDLFDGEKRLTRADIESLSAGADIGSRTRIALGSGSSSGFDLQLGNGIEAITINRTDTIDSIAARYSTTAAAIIEINNLRAPYLAPGGGPGLLAPGDSLLVPTQSQAAPTTQVRAPYLAPEDAVYGVDMKLDPTALANGLLDIRVAETGDSLDCELASGVSNVVQGTQITILTERGTTQFLPKLGIRRTVGVKGTIAEVLLASLRLREAVLSDSRIVGIQSLRVVLDGDTLTQEITPIVTGRRTGATLILPFGKASGG